VVARAVEAGVSAAGRARIVPPADAVARPQWSVMIPTFNCAEQLRSALTSVLRQDPGPEQMQIEVVDDCSTSDDPQAVVREIAGDRVTFVRQPRNVGHVANFNTCLQRSRGVLVHLLHGDDAVRDGFYRTLQPAFATCPAPGAAFCRYISIDERGHWQTISALERPDAGLLHGWLEQIAVGQRLQPPCMVVRRDVYEQLGGFDPRIGRYGEDWEMWARIAARYPVWFEPQPLAMYRVGSASLSATSMRSGQNVADILRAIDIIAAHLPRERAGVVREQAREVAATTALRRARRSIDAGDTATALAQVRAAARTSRSRAVVLGLAHTALRFAVRAARAGRG
jgi:GT2 family glycosyltransferase